MGPSLEFTNISPTLLRGTLGDNRAAGCPPLLPLGTHVLYLDPPYKFKKHRALNQHNRGTAATGRSLGSLGPTEPTGSARQQGQQHTGGPYGGPHHGQQGTQPGSKWVSRTASYLTTPDGWGQGQQGLSSVQAITTPGHYPGMAPSPQAHDNRDGGGQRDGDLTLTHTYTHTHVQVHVVHTAWWHIHCTHIRTNMRTPALTRTHTYTQKGGRGAKRREEEWRISNGGKRGDQGGRDSHSAPIVRILRTDWDAGPERGDTHTPSFSLLSLSLPLHTHTHAQATLWSLRVLKGSRVVLFPTSV
jgi:hypothetical protein